MNVRFERCILSGRRSQLRGWSSLELESWRGLAQHHGPWRDGPDDIELVSNGGCKVLDVSSRRAMHRLRDDQDGGRRIPDGRIAALPICPAPGVRPPRVVREDHFMSIGLLYFTGEGKVALVAVRVADFEVLSDRGGVEHGHRNCEGK